VISLKNSTVSAMGQLKTILRAKLEKYEGRVNHMYLDTMGHVTIGVGHLLDNATKAESIGLIYRNSKKNASGRNTYVKNLLLKAGSDTNMIY
jgi:GH24 family phage-related lysozyme (muramidase)